MKIVWRIALRDALGVLLLGFLGGFLGGMLADDPGEGIRAASAIVLMIAGFCVSGCLAKEARFKHLAVVATGVWLMGSIVSARSAEAPFLWSLIAVVPVFAAMLLGGLISLAIVGTPSATSPPQS
jgi:hypothetical protein